MVKLEECPNFKTTESKVFTEFKGKVYIGTEEIRPEIKAILKDQAKNWLTSQLYEILDATITNEAYNLALIQSKDMDNVYSAKMLHHWNFVLKNILKKLSE